MRTVELSNHPADALRIARQRRADGGQQTGADDGEALARHELLLKRAANARDRARSQRQWITWLRARSRSGSCGGCAPAAPPRLPAGRQVPRSRRPTPRRNSPQASPANSRSSPSSGRVLGDDWVLLRGYCNRRGEIDHLLLGPPGLVAIESKHLNATVHCDGDAWRFEKFDRFGNLVSRGTLGDRGGRSPSVQLNEPADLLEEFLRTRGGTVVRPAGPPAHPSNSRCGRCRNRACTSRPPPGHWPASSNDMPPVLGAAQRARIEELIARDHRYHEERRPARRTAGREAARSSNRSLGEIGIDVIGMPSASSIAAANTAAPGITPASPAPLMPSGFSGEGVSRWSISMLAGPR